MTLGPIVCFGDSITEGWGAEPEESYPAVLGQLLGLPVVNAGWRGDRAADALDRLDSQVLAEGPRLVVVSFGGNEADHGDTVEAALDAQARILSRLRAAGVPCVLLGARIPAYGDAWDEGLRALAEGFGCDLALGILNGILDDPAMRSDAEHPNAAGYAVLAERVLRVVERPLQRLGLTQGRRDAGSLRGP